jgi:hypothetical protein
MASNPDCSNIASVNVIAATSEILALPAVAMHWISKILIQRFSMG